MTRDEILQQLERSGLGQYTQAIGGWIFPTAQLHLEPASDEEISVGSSKAGGNPDLPEAIAWPRWKDFDMTFIAQINLRDCPALDESLPASGLLTFFYAVAGMYEDDEFYGDPLTCRVIYTNGEQLSQLTRRETPASLTDEARMKPNRISFIPGLSVPASESAYLESLGLGWNGNREDFDKYWEVFLKPFRAEGYINRFMGHPDQIQGDMQTGCLIATGEYNWDDMRNPELRDAILLSASKWRLLLQIDSEEEKTGIMWGDVGRIYYWIHEEDLRALRFDRVVCELQCC
ncbi:uncharacterized protein YwqG [Paenibacillus phyllosphaerae]|uniref:Uncharacterized protein YwqG n=1 Tax=Paenibacillus phyllosphaerae TaxID=274593 RepID=A0A7W5B0H6_9BACL|nr:YwqG family protein [Paenibacillus phyllosphaerae]MBB3112200.1 uncharacterized protein YwqG [Paenibacillus phyllosphaerae]